MNFTSLTISLPTPSTAKECSQQLSSVTVTCVCLLLCQCVYLWPFEAIYGLHSLEKTSP